jgi:hypothetical protein
MLDISPLSFSFREEEKSRLVKRSVEKGKSIRYYCFYYQPTTATKEDALQRVRRIKQVEDFDKSSICWMMDKSLSGIENFYWASDGVELLPENFSLIIPLPSEAPLVDYMMERIAVRTAEKRNVVLKNLTSGLLKKLSYEDVMIDENLLTWEWSDKTEPYVRRYMEAVRNWGEEQFEIKKINGRVRRYIYNFLGINENHPAFKSLLTAKRILLVDDTIGEGATFNEAARVISELNPCVSINALTLVRDFRSDSTASNSVKIDLRVWEQCYRKYDLMKMERKEVLV